jgi:two-component system, response regulator PdtaR
MQKPVVLIVEDEALIRMSAVQMVEDAGFSTAEACNADEATAILERRVDIRVVFTDVTMAGSMDGLRLAHAISGRWPPIYLIVTSGMHILDAAKLPANGRFIPKPYNADQITAALREFFTPRAPDPLAAGAGDAYLKSA